MATREELAIIRDARAGRISAQLELGKRYLSGGGGLPKSMETALHWLNCAARQESLEACLIIGRSVPFEVAQKAPVPASIWSCYERAFEAGQIEAGLVLARFLLARPAPGKRAAEPASQCKALKALYATANAGIAEAQWLLAQHIAGVRAAAAMDGAITPRQDAWLQWTISAACGGVTPARRALAEYAWTRNQRSVFLEWALPLARALGRPSPGGTACLEPHDITLLRRCAMALSQAADADQDELQRFWLLAAQAKDRLAQLSFGLWLARLNPDGTRAATGAASTNYKKAICWLAQAAAQGCADARYAMSRIYLKVEFCGRSVTEAQRCREQAAHMGHCEAQFESGLAAWRNRHRSAAGEGQAEVQAVYWLQKAAMQDCSRAAALLAKIAVPPMPAPWAQAALSRLAIRPMERNSFLGARIELAAIFGLSRAEALLIDLSQADCGVCLRVDLRARYRCGKRRLILLQTGEQRAALTRIAAIACDFEHGDHVSEQVLRNHVLRLYRLGAGSSFHKR